MSEPYDELFQNFQPKPAALWRWDSVAQRLLYCSEQFAEILEMSPAEALERLNSKEALHNLIHPEDRQRYIQVHSESIPGQGLQIEYRIITHNGKLKHISHIGMTIFDQNQKSMGVFVTSQDITEIQQQRKQVAQALLLSRHAERIASIGFYEWDHQQDYLVSCSEEYARIHGMSIQEALATYTNSEIDYLDAHPDDRERYILESKRANESGVNLDIQFRILLADGSIKHIREMNAFAFGKDGKVTSSYGAVQDLTEQVMLQEQLRQAQKLEVVGQLTGGIAHDFNNLLAVILGHAELMYSTSDKYTGSDPRLDAIVSAAERGAELTQHLLAFSRKQSLKPKILQLNEQLSGMLDLLKRTLGARIEVKIQHGQDLWPCYADAAQTENALLNLMVNARDAMPDGGTITVSTENVFLDHSDPLVPTELESDNYVLLSVTDTGIGMTDDVLAKVMEPFFTTKEPGKGTGLGLSMVYGFAKQSSGHLLVESALGEGTCVKLYLPASTQVKLESDADLMKKPKQNPRGSGNVMLVEDDLEMLVLVSSQLKELGYEVFQASDSSSALELLQELEHVDLLLTDVIFPGDLNGHDLAQKTLQLQPKVKVLYMSGYVENRIFEQANMERGVNFLKKPFKKEELAELVHKLLSDQP